MDPLIRRLRRRLLAWLHRSRSDQIYFMRRLSYKDVKRATDGFHRIIYSNSQVAAYTAKFEDGSISLVKEIKVFDQADHIFCSEVQFLGHLHHRHLLSLRGFSLNHKRFVPLSDFGLLTCVGNAVMMLNSRDDSMMQKNGNIIFQFGVFILELVTGQSSEMEGSDLIEWIQESRFYSSIDKMVDPDLGDNYDSRELKTLLAVAKLCIKSRDKPVFTIPQLLRYIFNRR